ncbi:hypothetical protein LguiB_034588 [Lonicera macranthoides]
MVNPGVTAVVNSMGMEDINSCRHSRSGSVSYTCTASQKESSVHKKGKMCAKEKDADTRLDLENFLDSRGEEAVVGWLAWKVGVIPPSAVAKQR